IYQGLPDIAGDGSGNFMVVWEDARGSLDIYAQLFDQSGSPVGENFKVNADSGVNLHNSPSCAMSSSGDFGVVWAAREGNVQNVYGRLFWSNGQPKDTCFKINDDGQEVDHRCPDISMDSLGNFVVAWEDERDGLNRIYLQRYNYDGDKLGDNFPLYSDNPDPTQNDPDLGLNKIGEFVVVWTESGKVLAQRYDSSGARIGNNIVVVDNPLSSPEDPKVKVTDNGYFVVAWTDHRREGSDIYLQTYLNGSPQGPNRLVNTDTGQALQTSAGIDCWDNFLYSVWMDNRIAEHGFDIYFNTVNFKETAVEDEEENEDLSEKLVLYQNHPNPFNPYTSIQYTVSSRETRPIHTTLKIYNVRGQLVKTLIEEEKPLGNYQVSWNGRNDRGKEVASGIYFYQLKVGNQMLAKKMLLLR
ncbi:MAG: FlgD immunoglobulin-like domain containing protein, partial [Candidatus Zixiibacteriota bacterium]